MKTKKVPNPATISFATGDMTDDYTTAMWAALGHAVIEARHLTDRDLTAKFDYWDARGVRKGRKTTTARWFATSMTLTYGSEKAFRRATES